MGKHGRATSRLGPLVHLGRPFSCQATASPSARLEYRSSPWRHCAAWSLGRFDWSLTEGSLAAVSLVAQPSQARYTKQQMKED